MMSAGPGPGLSKDLFGIAVLYIFFYNESEGSSRTFVRFLAIRLCRRWSSSLIHPYVIDHHRVFLDFDDDNNNSNSCSCSGGWVFPCLATGTSRMSE